MAVPALQAASLRIMLPKLFELGPLTIHTYGLLLATAFLTATALLAHLAERDGIPRNRAWDLGFVVIISALLGAKLLMVLGNLGYYLRDPSRFLSVEFWQAGGAFFGGLIGATLGCLWYVGRDPHLRFWKVADTAAPAIALGQGIGRLGCFAAGCDWGTPTDLPWAVQFTSQYAHENVGVPLNTPLHPVQLYESVAVFGLFVLLLWARSWRRFEGQVICLYFLGYGFVRFFIEFFRGDPGRGFVLSGQLSVPQVIAAVLFVAALAAHFLLSSHQNTNRA